jgi:TPR repeat protein
MLRLGIIYSVGLLGVRDYAKARDWFEKAAAKGNTDAKQLLEKLPTNQPAGGKR